VRKLEFREKINLRSGTEEVLFRKIGNGKVLEFAIEISSDEVRIGFEIDDSIFSIPLSVLSDLPEKYIRYEFVSSNGLHRFVFVDIPFSKKFEVKITNTSKNTVTITRAILYCDVK